MINRNTSNKKIENHQLYTFKDLKKEMWVFDKETNCIRKINRVYVLLNKNCIEFDEATYPEIPRNIYFEENRFYSV